MIEIKSKKETQVIEVVKTAAGVSIKVIDAKKHTSKAVHIFSECVPELIRALVLSK